MRTLLILIIAGFVLLSLGSPEKVSGSITNLANVVRQLPEKTAALTAESEPTPSDVTAVEPVDFNSVGQQQDIPASEVLGAPILPETTISGEPELASVKPAPPQQSYGHQDRYSIEEIHTVNAEALKILDRIANTYQ